jgi:hypothetical protein
MQNMKLKQLLIIISLSGILLGCDNKSGNVAPTVEDYPMTVGSEWIYNRLIIMKYFESKTSDKVTEIDSINFTVKVWIDKDTVLNDTLPVKVFRSQESDEGSVSTLFLNMDKEGLKTYAYSNPMGATAFAKKGTTIKPDFVPYLNMATEGKARAKSDIVFEDKPALNIKMPLTLGSSWTYRYPTETIPLQIVKKVTGTETINIAGENFSCFKIQFEYLYSPAFEGISLTDWISNKGLIKRKTVHKRVTLTYRDGEPSDSNVQLIEILTLKDLKLK